MRAKYGQYSSCCDFVVYFNLLSVIGLFTKQFNNALNLHKITKIRVKSQKHGRYTGDFPQRPLYTGMPVYTYAGDLVTLDTGSFSFAFFSL